MLTPQEYLGIEREAEWRNEYLDGEMVERERPSLRHSLIVTNLMVEIGNRLLETPFIVHCAGLRVTTDPLRHYAYPDVVVALAPEFLETDTLTNPSFLAEVLSETTEKYDRGAKFERYRGVPSLAEYLLVAQDRVHVELYTRQPDGAWILHEWNDPAEEIELASVRCRVSIAGIYAKVDFAAPG